MVWDMRFRVIHDTLLKERSPQILYSICGSILSHYAMQDISEHCKKTECPYEFSDELLLFRKRYNLFEVDFPNIEF